MVVCVGSVIDWTKLTRGGFYFEGLFILILSSRSCAVCLYFVPSKTAVYFNPYLKLPVQHKKSLTNFPVPDAQHGCSVVSKQKVLNDMDNIFRKIFSLQCD